MRINYVLDSAFPTEKAYGVTTENTINALSKMGHNVVLFCHKPEKHLVHNLSNSQIKYYKSSYLNRKLRKMALASHGMSSKIAWNLSKQLSHFENRHLLDMESCEIIWTRENPIPRYAKSKFAGTEVIEIHNIISNRTKKLLKKLDPKKVVLCPISKTLENLLQKSFPEYKILWSPMGIKHVTRTESKIKVNIEQHYSNNSESISIGYFGKLAPNGVSKGFEDILDLGIELSRRSVAFKLIFVGPQASEVKLLTSEMKNRGIQQENVLIQTHLHHNEGLQLMQQCDFLMLPASRDINYSGFPLKALEYVNSLRVVIAGKSQANQEVFLEKFQPFWYERNNLNELAILLSRPPDIGFLKNYLHEGYLYAKKFSWDQRTHNILDSVHEIIY